jgi:hypothetical protein
LRISSDNDFGHLSENDHSELHEEQIPAKEVQAEGGPALVPLENHRPTILSTKNERVFCHNYEIGLSVWLHFQDPSTWTINGKDINLFERIFMAGLRLLFPKIARELLLILMIAPSQLVLNAWKYLFASYIVEDDARNPNEHPSIFQHVPAKDEA